MSPNKVFAEAGVGAGAERPSISTLREQRRTAQANTPEDTRGAILAGLERVLADSSLHDVPVARILAEAGVSRMAFYSYFESKYEAAGALLAAVMDSVFENWRPFVDGAPTDDPIPAMLEALRGAFELWSAHGAVARMVHQYWSSVPEIGAQWLAVMERFTAAFAEAIDRARATGSLPPGTDSRKIAAAGLWASEQLGFVSAFGRSADLSDPETVFEAAADMWFGLLYRPGTR